MYSIKMPMYRGKIVYMAFGLDSTIMKREIELTSFSIVIVCIDNVVSHVLVNFFNVLCYQPTTVEKIA